MSQHSLQPTGSALRALALEYKSLQEEPVEGFRVKLAQEDNLFEWEVAIFGPPETLYQGGYFKVCIFNYLLNELSYRYSYIFFSVVLFVYEFVLTYSFLYEHSF